MPRKNTAVVISALFIFLFHSFLSAQQDEETYSPRKVTYLPEYRLQQMFPADVSGNLPWYDMNPFPRFENPYYNKKRILPTDYRQARGEYLLGNFDEFIYFTVGFSQGDALDFDAKDRENMLYLSRIPAMYKTQMSLCLSGSSQEILPWVRDEEQLIKTVETIQDTLKKYNLSGIDLDWEFPRNDEEKEIHLAFIRELKLMTQATGKTLSMAVSRYRLLKEEVYSLPDTIHLMAYDFYGRHSTWEGTLEAVEYMMARFAIPPEKILLGLPFYGRIFDGYSPDYWKKSQSYFEIVRDYAPGPDSDEAGGYFFNGPDTVRKKLNIAAEHTLSGIFIWEIGQDIFTGASLSRVILDYPG